MREIAFTLPAPKTSLSETERCVQTSDLCVFLIIVVLCELYWKMLCL